MLARPHQMALSGVGLWPSDHVRFDAGARSNPELDGTPPPRGEHCQPNEHESGITERFL